MQAVCRPLNPFAAIEQSINAGVAGHLSNAVAEYGGQRFGVLFSRAAADDFGQTMDAASHTCECSARYLPALVQGSELLIDGVAYVVAGGVQPDSSGWVALSIYPKDH